MHKFEENVKESVSIPGPIATSTTAVFYTAAEKVGTGVDMAKFNNFVGVISQASGTQWQGAVTYVIAESTDNSAWSNTYLATTTVASSTTADQVDTVEIRAEEMSDTYRYARVEATPAAGTGNVFSVVNLRFNPRFAAV